MSRNLFPGIFIFLCVFFANMEIGKDIHQPVYARDSVETLNETAKKYWYVSPAKSVTYGRQALALAREEENKKQEVIALRYIGVGYMNLGDYDKALEYYFESSKIAKKMNYTEGISASLNNIALVYDYMGLKEKSLRYYKASLEIDEKLEDKEGIAISLNNIALVYADLEQNDKALKYFLKSLKISEEINFRENTAMTLGNIGDRYNKLGDYDKALDYSLKGLALSRQLGNKRGIASKLTTIGEIYKNRGEFENALRYLNESIKIVQTAGLKEAEKENCKILSEVYSDAGNTEEALRYFKRYALIKDELLNKEITEKIEQIETKYEIEKREKEKKILELKLNKLTILRNSLFSGFMLILILAYVIYNRYRLKEKAHRNIVALSKIGQEITSSLDLEKIFNTFYENVKVLMPTGGFGIGIYEEQKKTTEYKFFIRNSERLPVFSDEMGENSFAAWCIRNKKEIFINDMEKEGANYVFGQPVTYKEQNICSAICLPLIAKDSTLGVITVQSYLRNAYSVYYLDILKTLASYLAIALDNSNAYIQIGAQKKEIEENLAVIESEKEKSEKLLLNILPFRVANDLKLKHKTEPELFNDVTVYFSDLAGFTKMSSMLEPKVLIGELNDIYTAFDNIMEENHCERIKTIGDAYLAVCGLPEPNPHNAENIMRSSIEIRRYLADRNEKSEIKWQIRIGIHTGKVVAGVVGVKKYIYDVFGDTINTASRMESNSMPMKINVSEVTYQLLKGHFKFIEREESEVKGKGKMKMYFVAED